MKVSARKQLSAYIDNLARIFHDVYVASRAGWGQFLDGNIHNEQVGRYGTSSGAIVLALSGRHSTPIGQKVYKTLQDWLTSSDVQCEYHRSQTLPLVMMYLGACYLQRHNSSGQEESEYFLQEVRTSIVNRQLQHNKLWGNYWLDETAHDEIPSVFVSSITLLTLYLADRENGSYNDLNRAALALQDSYLKDPDSYANFSPLILTTIFLYLGEGASRKILEELNSLSHKSPDVGYRFNYFYDYELPDDSWRREYFILPISLVQPLIMYSERVPASVALYVDHVGRQLRQNLDQHQNVYKVSASDRISTLEQGFVALCLQALIESENRTRPLLSMGRIRYELWVQRPSWDRWAYHFLLFAYLVVIVSNALPSITDQIYSPWKDLFVKSTLVIIGMIEDPRIVVRKVLRLDR